MMNQIIITIALCSISFSLMADSAFEATVLHATDQDCSNGEIVIGNLDGFAPYEFVWTAGNDNTTISTEQSLSGMGEGLYCVTVTDALCGVASACFEIKCQECFSNDTQAEVGADNVTFDIDVTGISTPLNIRIVETLTGALLDEVFVVGSGPLELSNLDFQIGHEYCIVYLDDDGCTFSDCFTVEGNTCPDDIEISLVQITDPACGGGNGSIAVNIDSDCTALAVYWDNDPSLTGTELSDAEPGQHCIYVQSTSDTDCPDCFAVQCFDVYGVEGYFNTVCAKIYYAAGEEECEVEDVDIETESCGETVVISTGDTGEICVEIPEGECVELEIPNCDLGPDCIDINDMIALREMILWITTSVDNHPYVAFIGDANGNSYISTIDLVYIMRYVLDIPTPNNRVGECVLFTPESIVPNPLSHISYSGSPNNELCDGDNGQEFLLGVIGDGDGSCDCELNGLIPQEGEIKMEIGDASGGGQVLSFEEPLQFYDCVITLSAPQLGSTEGLKFTAVDSESAHLAMDIKGDDLIITMHSKKKSPITLKKNEQFFVINSLNPVKLNAKSKYNLLIDKELAVRPITGPRERQKSIDSAKEQLFTVAQNMLMMEDGKIDQAGEIRIMTIDGRMLYQVDFDQYESIDLSPWTNHVLIVQYLSERDGYQQVVFNY